MKNKGFILLLILLTSLCVCVGVSAASSVSVAAGEIRLKSLSNGMSEDILSAGQSVVLVSGSANDAATMRMLDFLAPYAEQFREAGVRIVFNFDDANPNDPKVEALAKQKGANLISFTCGGAPNLKSKLAQAGIAKSGAGASVMVIQRDGDVLYGKSGALTDADKNKLVNATIKSADDAQIQLNTKEKTLKKGKTFSLKPKLLPKVSAKHVRYESSDTSVARISQSGKVKAVRSGTATITAWFGDEAATCEVTVVTPLKSIVLSPKTVKLNVGDEKNIDIARLSPSDASVDMATASWTSSNVRVATVEDGRVTAQSAGKAKIKVTLGGKSATCTVTIKAGVGSVPLSGTLEDQVLALVNYERSLQGVSSLSMYSPLCSAATVRAEEISRVFSHTRPSGKAWNTAIGFSYTTAGENIAVGFDTAEDVVNAWMNSPGHKRNILDSRYREMGLAIYDKGGTLYWAQMFSKKK